MFKLPQQLKETLSSLPGFAAALTAGGTKLRALLGDLDVAWQQDSSAQCLRELPHPLLLQLLADPDTRAASEDTVLYTIDQWLRAAGYTACSAQLAAVVTEEQVAELLQQVRLPRWVLLEWVLQAIHCHAAQLGILFDKSCSTSTWTTAACIILPE